MEIHRYLCRFCSLMRCQLRVMNVKRVFICLGQLLLLASVTYDMMALEEGPRF